MTDTVPRASGLALLSAGLGLLLGAAALWVGLGDGAIAQWAFGTACLLQVPPALSLRGRVLDGLGNRGLERERRTLRSVSYLLRFLALGTAMAAVSALLGERSPRLNVLPLGLSLMATASLGGLWLVKRSLEALHPALAQDASRSRTLFELAALLLAGSLLGRWFPWADASTALVMAVGLFVEGRTLGKGSTLAPPSCAGGCGSCG